MTTVYDHSAKTIAGEELPLSSFRGQVLLIVNTASECGFTPQYAGLEALQRKFAGQGFSVLGFPSNQFGAQEPGAEAEIASFCTAKYGVTFPMFAKVDVNGAGAHPLFKHLKSAKTGLLGGEAIKWNFTKFLVDREGNVAADAVEKGFWPPEKAILIQRHGPRRNIDSRGALCRFAYCVIESGVGLFQQHRPATALPPSPKRWKTPSAACCDGFPEQLKTLIPLFP